MKKHIMKMLMAVLLLIGVFGMNVSAADEGDFKYQEVDGGIEITHYYGSDTNLVIPSTIEGKPVVSIGEYALSYNNFTSVEIPATVKILKEQSFAYCKQLTKVTFKGNGLETIGDRAFFSCIKLKDFTFPSSLKTIEEVAFGYCASLTYIDLSKYSSLNLERGVFWQCKGITYISFPASLAAIPEDICDGCESLKTAVINGNNVKVIGVGAFRDCDSLTTINIPNSVVKIETYAFAFAKGLKTITIPASVQEIGYYGFGETGLQTVYCQYGSYAYKFFKNKSGIKVVASGTYLKKTSITIYVGEKKTLPLVNNNGKTTFTSSKKKVVSVSSKGVIKGLKKGTATITAKNGNVVSKCKVTVKNRSLNHKKVTITEGFSLKLKLSGEGTVKWSSSNNSVATVSKKGVVKAKQPGKVTITAKSKGKKYTCKVTVAKNEKTFTYSKSGYDYLQNQSYYELSKVYKNGSNYVTEFTFHNSTSYTITSIYSMDIYLYAGGDLFLIKNVRNVDTAISPHSQKVISFEFSGSEVRQKKVDLRNTSIRSTVSNCKVVYTYYTY